MWAKLLKAVASFRLHRFFAELPEAHGEGGLALGGADEAQVVAVSDEGDAAALEVLRDLTTAFPGFEPPHENRGMNKDVQTPEESRGKPWNQRRRLQTRVSEECHHLNWEIGRTSWYGGPRCKHTNYKTFGLFFRGALLPSNIAGIRGKVPSSLTRPLGSTPFGREVP